MSSANTSLNTTIEDLPDDILRHVAKNLGALDVIRLQSASKRLRDVEIEDIGTLVLTRRRVREGAGAWVEANGRRRLRTLVCLRTWADPPEGLQEFVAKHATVPCAESLCRMASVTSIRSLDISVHVRDVGDGARDAALRSMPNLRTLRLTIRCPPGETTRCMPPETTRKLRIRVRDGNLRILSLPENARSIAVLADGGAASAVALPESTEIFRISVGHSDTLAHGDTDILSFFGDPCRNLRHVHVGTDGMPPLMRCLARCPNLETLTCRATTIFLGDELVTSERLQRISMKVTGVFATGPVSSASVQKLRAVPRVRASVERRRDEFEPFDLIEFFGALTYE